jgi:hypothetical protein
MMNEERSREKYRRYGVYFYATKNLQLPRLKAYMREVNVIARVACLARSV